MLTDELARDAEARLLARVERHRRGAPRRLPPRGRPATGRWGRSRAARGPTASGSGSSGWRTRRPARRGIARGASSGRSGSRGRERQASHDIGFLFQYGAVLGWRTVREPFLRELGLAAADRLVAMWHPRARVIPVGSHAEVSSGLDDVTIDCLMNLQVLWWAAAETGDARYREVAVAHAERTAAWHVRGDGSCYQSVHFDPETGEPYKKHTHQGYSPDGCWARGLGWCAYGFLEAHRATGRRTSSTLPAGPSSTTCRRTPADPVTFNDYDDPRIPAAPRDTSAAAILASAAIELAQPHRGGAVPPARAAARWRRWSGTTSRRSVPTTSAPRACCSTAATTSTAARLPTTSWSGATTSSSRRCSAGEESPVSAARGLAHPLTRSPMIRLVTLDFWHTLFADTADGLRRAHALRLEGVRAALAEAGHLYDAAELAAADARAGEALAAVWREHRDIAADEQLRVFLGGLDPDPPGGARTAWRSIGWPAPTRSRP